MTATSAFERSLSGGLSALVALSFMGARGCIFAGDVSLGDNGYPRAPVTAGTGAAGGSTAADAGQGDEATTAGLGGTNPAGASPGPPVGDAGQAGEPAATGGTGTAPSGGSGPVGAGTSGTGGATVGTGGATASAGADGGGTSGAGGTGGGWTASVEDEGTDCQVDVLPDANAVPTIVKLPDPFTKLDGTRLSARSEWRCRREELKKQAEKYAFGTKPEPPKSVSGTVTSTQISVEVTDLGKSSSFSVNVALPANGKAPYPAIIAYGGLTALDPGVVNSAGVAVITYDPGAVGAENHQRGPTQAGAFYNIYERGSATGLLVAWSWGVSRIIDVIAQSDGSILRWDAIAVSGCSKYGKGAFLAGVLDERVALTMPIESGTAGVPIWRGIALGETGPNDGQPLSLSETYSEAPWFADGFDFFTTKPTALPIDTHELVAMVAPRGLFVMENPEVDELSTKYGHVAVLGGAEVYAALGARENVTYTSDIPASEGAHCSGRPEWAPLLQRNLEKFLTKTGNEPGTIDAAAKQTGSLAEWRDWTTPTLN